MSENPRIVPPRVPFVDPRTGGIAREWFHWLLAVVKRNNDTEVLAVFDAAFGRAEISKTQVETRDSRLLAQIPSPVPQVSKRDLQDTSLTLPARLNAEIGKLNRRIQDVELLAMVPRVVSSSSDETELDCDTLEAIGYWSPVTDGASNIIYSGGQVVVAFTCTE